ncbi:SDR family NAD(P)-dependent oxidoreductase [Sphingopyxis sp. MG]|uniref:SDR family NAD(P)-dependent oxidoreductase n=1 Tax=Sphingopyxis sp. MG TaxID=1866325 RepID=UPI000CDF4AA3|nr:SDR family NAD(P)-dependent oxidoreductase [Sphingopyxis sp. MG]AVA12749.1 short-chain dehydrogenase [Sphingopyxis sp. MG]
MEQVEGKVAFITGGASGIGFGMAQAFGEAGMKLVIADVHAERRETAVGALSESGFACHGVDLDVRSAASWKAAADDAEARFGAVDILCNNAGVGQGRRTDGTRLLLEATDEELFRLVFDINVMGPFLGVRTMVPRIVARGAAGHIVNTGSMAGLIAPPGLATYSASKYAVTALSESLRAELAARNIGVSLLCPGGVQSSLDTTSAERRNEQLGSGFDREAGFLSNRPINPEMMEPVSVGRRVLRAIRDNDFYIFTHPEYAGLIEERYAAIRHDIGSSAQDGYVDPDWLLAASRNPAYSEDDRGDATAGLSAR